MSLARIVGQLIDQPLAGYQANTRPASEPVAWVSMLLSAIGERSAAQVGAQWLAQIQSPDGSVGVRENEADPQWPTGLAVLTWISAQQSDESSSYARAIDQGLRWIVSHEGKTQARDPQTGHDTTIAAWPWVDGTHSWIEPTAIQLLALRAAGMNSSPRTATGMSLLIDRQLDRGGCNYGNTTVLGQELRPHLLPTALALLALAGFPQHPKTERTIAYAERRIADEVGTISLALGLLALTAHDRPYSKSAERIESAREQVERSDQSPFKLALLGHALLGSKSPVIALVHEKNP